MLQFKHPISRSDIHSFLCQPSMPIKSEATAALQKSLTMPTIVIVMRKSEEVISELSAHCTVPSIKQKSMKSNLLLMYTK